MQDCPKGRILPGEANGQTENTIETFVTYDLHSVDEKILPKPFPSRATPSFEKYLQLSPQDWSRWMIIKHSRNKVPPQLEGQYFVKGFAARPMMSILETEEAFQRA
jgi:hypothetical protein